MDFIRNNKWKVAFGVAIAIVVCLLFANGAHAEGLMLANGAAVVGDTDFKALADEFKAKNSEFKGVADELRQAHVELKAKTDGNERISAELKATIDSMMTKFNGVKQTMDDLEQKMAANVELEQKSAKTWGQQLVESEAYKNAPGKSGNGAVRFGTSVKQVTSAAAGGMIVSKRETEIVGLVQERRVMRDLLTTVPINTSSVDYPIQTTRTNSAAPVAEGAAKPYSDYAWSSASVVVRTLAHLAKLTRQALDDAPRLSGEVDQEMRYGLGYIEERQFLYGTGVGENLHGIIPQATAFAVNAGYTRNALATRIDVLRLAMLQVAIGLIPADAIVLNPVDWALIELTKTEDGAYLFANPQGSVSPRMWGLPVVATPAMAADDFLVGAFKAGATVYDRMGVEVLVSTENSDDFEKNLATMRAEERVAIAVKRPGVFVTGDFTAALVAAQPAA